MVITDHRFRRERQMRDANALTRASKKKKGEDGASSIRQAV